MRKIFGILFILLSLNETAYAELNLYCKQEIRIINEKKQIPMIQDWEIVITDTEIKVPRWSTLFAGLVRKDEKENEYSAASEMALIPNAGGVAYFRVISIDRTTGKGYHFRVINNESEKDLFVCTNKKIKKENLF